MTYYTMQITLIDNSVFELKDFDQPTAELFRKSVWTTGIKRQTAPKTWELISPLVIKKILMIQQDQKHSA